MTKQTQEQSQTKEQTQKSEKLETFEQRYDRLKWDLIDSQEVIISVEKKYGWALKSQDIVFLDKTLWTAFLKHVLLLDPTSDVVKESWDNQKIQLKTIEALVRELKTMELSKWAQSLKLIASESRELKTLQIKLLTKSEKDEIDYLKEQIKESIDTPSAISTSSLIGGSVLEKKISEKDWKEKSKEFFDWLDELWLNIINDSMKHKNLNETTKKNMATGLNFAFMDLLSWLSDDYKKQTVEKLSWLQKKPADMKWFLDFIKKFSIWEVKVFDRIEKLLNIVDDYSDKKKIDQNWQWGLKNKSLVNSKDFCNLSVGYVKWSTDQNVIQMLSAWEKSDYKDVKMSPEDNKQLFMIADKFGKWKEMEIAQSINSLKMQWKDALMQNWEAIMSMKKMFDDLWIWDMLEKLLNWICKFLWYKGWFKDFEKQYIMKSLDFTEPQRDQFKKLYDEYLWSYQKNSDSSEDSKSIKSAIKESLKLSDNDQQKKKHLEMISWLNISTFRKTLEKGTLEWIAWRKHSNYFIPDALLLKHWKDLKLDVFNAEGKPDENKLNAIKLNKEQEESLISTFLISTSTDLLSNKDLVEQMEGAEDFSYLLYAKYLKPQTNDKWINNFLYYKSYMFATETELQSWNVKPWKYKYVPAGSLPISRFKEYFSNGDKKLWELNFDESKSLLTKIFWEGPWTQLLIKIANAQPVFITRTIALARHEWWLNFGRENTDPNPTQENIWTFQISAPSEWGKSARESVQIKYQKVLNTGIAMCKEMGIQVDQASLTPAQKDLISWIWYVKLQRWGDATFAKLRDPNLSQDQLVELMSKTIQWWIAAIWNSVVSQMKSLPVDTTKLA